MKTSLSTLLIFANLFFLTFQTASAQVTVTAPNGGETLNIASTYTITWSASASGTSTSSVNIDYSINNGSSWISVATSISLLTKKYIWTVPNNPSSQCLVKVYNSSTSDVSNAVFTITTTGTATPELGNNKNTSIKFYPNPVTDYLNIINKTDDRINSVKIYNSVGSLVGDYQYDAQAVSSSIVIPVYALAKGVYYFQVNSESGMFRKKVIVTK
jgi:hypothetical protein